MTGSKRNSRKLLSKPWEELTFYEAARLYRQGLLCKDAKVYLIIKYPNIGQR